MYKVSSRLPADVHGHTYAYYLQKEYGLPNIFYVDLWPIAASMCIITDPAMAAQLTQKDLLPKFQNMERYLEPMIDADNMVSLSGPAWKKLRAMFNPGFSSGHLITLVPAIVDNATTFVETLSRFADAGKTVRMEEETTKVTVDIIGKVILDSDLNCQRSENELLKAFKSQAASLPGSSVFAPWMAYDPRRLLLQRRNKRVMDNYLRNEIIKRLKVKENGGEKGKQKYVIDLALDTYLQANPSAGMGLDPLFIKQAITQIKTFIFAGHDTTSSTLTYIYHLLSLNPDCLRLVREEHERVLPGSSPEDTAAAIQANASLLSNANLPYTLAVIRETLRLYPAASAVRMGMPDVSIVEPGTGRTYPTDGFMVWVVHHAMHRRSDLFPYPLEFRPERFLASPPAPFPDPMPKDAWRPFEKGPRNCIGQELSVLEIKIIMALSIRFFDVEADYAGEDRDATPCGSKTRQGQRGARAETAEKSSRFRGESQNTEWNQVDGERAYQVLIGSAKPKDGFPCKIRKAKPAAVA
ncbi:P450 monooxygenase AflN 4 [Colletotrichum chlorophyti]|uniref:p450 monooxygenase AflN 4 n=1 Tax=Colletotrichum chlorophyti TaxID=708187 RepID=A0A1Q8RX51_9PEZI|nr:P450 monooxygenase AflN 4 [Colletotrichum chlorophyti]